jgi:hypothetical protein
MVTEKADIYSAGMVILELLTGRPPAWNNSSGKIEYITDHIQCLQDVIGQVDRKAGFPYKIVQRLGNLALRSIHEKEQNRPTFVEMVADLRTLIGDMSLRGATLSGVPEKECVSEQYCSHVDLSPAHGLSRSPSQQKSCFFQPANCGTKEGGRLSSFAEDVKEKSRNRNDEIDEENNTSRWKAVSRNGCPIGVRSRPTRGREMAGGQIKAGSIIVVDELYEADGVTYLHLADGQGWVFDRNDEGVLFQRMEASTGFVDEDGDSIILAVEDGKLIRYVNGRKLVGENDSSGVVEKLTYQPSRPASVRDQYGWGSEDFPLKVVSELKVLADSLGVPNNLPKANSEPEKTDAPQYARILQVRAAPSGCSAKFQASTASNRLECDNFALQQKWMQEMTQMFENVEKENADLRSTISILEKGTAEKGTAGNSDLERSLMARLARSEQQKKELEHLNAELEVMNADVEARNGDLIIRISSSEQRRQELEQENSELETRVHALETDRVQCRPPETRSGHQHDVQRQLEQEELKTKQLQEDLKALQKNLKSKKAEEDRIAKETHLVMKKAMAKGYHSIPSPSNVDAQEKDRIAKETHLVMKKAMAIAEADAQEVQASLQSQLHDYQSRTKQAEATGNRLQAEKETLLRKIRELEEELWLAGNGENGQAQEIASDGLQSAALSYVSSSGESVQYSQVIKLSSSDLLDSPRRQARVIDESGDVTKQISKGAEATSTTVGMLSLSMKTVSPSTGDCTSAGTKRILPNTRRGLLFAGPVVLRTAEPPGQEL